jgi:hypothetical protein
MTLLQRRPLPKSTMICVIYVIKGLIITMICVIYVIYMINPLII